MARADRLARLDAQRIETETEYLTALVGALRATAAGQWGLFAHNKDRAAIRVTEPVLAELEELAAIIDNLRERLSMPAFDLHRQFVADRGPVKSDAVGEPRQAQAWLARLERENPEFFAGG